jgi:hypothetical protein
MVPLIVHAAGAGACWAPSAVPAITTAIAAALIATLDIVAPGSRSPKTGLQTMALLPWTRASRISLRGPEPGAKDKSMASADRHISLLS